MGETNGADEARQAVAAAVAEAIEETGYEEPPRGFAASIAAPVEASPAEGDSSDNPTAADLATIEGDPKLKAVYRSLVRRQQEQAGKIAAQQLDVDQALEVADAFRRDPQGSIRAMVRAAGLRIDEPTIADRVRTKLARSVGDEAAQALTPALVDGITEITSEIISPLAGEYVQRQNQEALAGLSAGIQAFARDVAERGGEWNAEVEREMAALVSKVMPGRNTTLPDYLQTLHNTVTARRERRQRGHRAASSRSDIRPGMDAREAVRIAVAAARRDLAR